MWPMTTNKWNKNGGHHTHYQDIHNSILVAILYYFQCENDVSGIKMVIIKKTKNISKNNSKWNKILPKTVERGEKGV